MPSLKEQAQVRGLVGKIRKLETENAELKALVQTLTTWNEAFKRKLKDHGKRVLRGLPEAAADHDD